MTDQPDRLLSGHPSSLDTVAEQLGRRIVTGPCEPGSVLPTIEALAKEFAVSRPAMRESMRMLAAKGLIEARPRRGTVVRPRSDWNRLDPDVLRWQISDRPSVAFVRSVFEVRRIIEPEAAALISQRATPDVISAIELAFEQMATADPTSVESIAADVAFHQAILAGTGNELIAAFSPVMSATLNVTFQIQRAVGFDRGHFVPAHKSILDAIRYGGPERARETYRKLLDTAEEDAIRGIRKQSV